MYFVSMYDCENKPHWTNPVSIPVAKIYNEFVRIFSKSITHTYTNTITKV